MKFQRRAAGALVLVLCGAGLGALVFDGAAAYGFAHPARLRGAPAPVLRLFQNLYIRSRNIVQFDESCSRYDDELGWTLRPGGCRFVNSEFSIEIKVNRLGLRDSDESLRGPQTIVLGDSYAMGWGVREEEAFPRIIARATGTRVLNAGIPGYGTVREMRLLDRLDVSRLSTLIVQYCPNDYDEDNKDFLENGGAYVPMPRAQYEDILANDRRRRSYFPGKYALGVASEALGPLFRTNAPPAAGAPSAEREAAAFLNALAHAGRARLAGVRIVVFSVGDAEFISALKTAARAGRSPPWIKNIEVVDLPDRSGEPSSGFILDDHLAPRGHALVAAALLRTYN